MFFKIVCVFNLGFAGERLKGRFRNSNFKSGVMSWVDPEAHSHSAIQDIPWLLWTREYITRVHRNPPLNAQNSLKEGK